MNSECGEATFTPSVTWVLFCMQWGVYIIDAEGSREFSMLLLTLYHIFSPHHFFSLSVSLSTVTIHSPASLSLTSCQTNPVAAAAAVEDLMAESLGTAVVAGDVDEAEGIYRTTIFAVMIVGDEAISAVATMVDVVVAVVVVLRAFESLSEYYSFYTSLH